MKKEWERLEPIRTRIMSEAYNLADRGDSEGYNSVKVMCSDVLALIETEIATERNALDLQTTIERGTKAWADVPNATEWVEELRGNDTPEVTPAVDKAYAKLDTTAGVLHKEWVGLESDEQILEISKDAWGKDKLNRGRDDHRSFYIAFARAIEDKLKEENT
jgi:hypothetical protein